MRENKFTLERWRAQLDCRDEDEHCTLQMTIAVVEYVAWGAPIKYCDPAVQGGGIIWWIRERSAGGRGRIKRRCHAEHLSGGSAGTFLIWISLQKPLSLS